MFLSTYFPYWSRHETSEKNHTWPASIVIELPILGASNHANVWVFFQTKTAQKNFANAAFVPQNHMFFAKKNTINFECDTKKAHIHPPPPQQKNQNPCLTNKIRTTKKPPHLYIYIHTYLHCALRRVQAVAGHFAWSQLCGPQEGLTAADAHGLATRDDATGGRGLRLRQQFGGVRCPEAEASADARSFFGGVGSSAGVGLFWVKFLVNS